MVSDGLGEVSLNRLARCQHRPALTQVQKWSPGCSKFWKRRINPRTTRTVRSYDTDKHDPPDSVRLGCEHAIEGI